ncbi:MAG: aminotransferase class V-fold PLP-dependent enzyme [Methanomicrobiales archaeon]|nr:aminotransferase class V-fold PLP-dependent enzyme [Methanomicrobiales archaeon]
MNPGLTYCNNAASTWPKPSEVLDAVQESFQLPYFEAGRSTIEGLEDYPELAREALADLFHFDVPDHIVFTQNATDSLNMLIHGFCAATRDRFHVITSDLEHNSVLRPLTLLASEGKITLSIIHSDKGYITVKGVEDALVPETHLAVLSHGSNVLGTRQDIGGIGEVLYDHGVYFIADGAQTAGLVPIDLNQTPVDAFVFTGHKYLFGLPGIGGFLIKDPSRITPVRQGGTGVDSGNLAHPVDMPAKFESGTHNYPGIVSLWAGSRYISRQGVHNVLQKCQELTSLILHECTGNDHITLDNPEPDLPVISLSLDSLDCEDVGYILLKKYRIIVRTGLHCAPLIHQKMNGGEGTVRISLSSINTPEECKYVSHAIREVADHAHP